MSNYYVICDSTNNTPESITRGELIVDFGITFGITMPNINALKYLNDLDEQRHDAPEDFDTKLERKAKERKLAQQARLKNIFGPKQSKWK